MAAKRRLDSLSSCVQGINSCHGFLLRLRVKHHNDTAVARQPFRHRLAQSHVPGILQHGHGLKNAHASNMATPCPLFNRLEAESTAHHSSDEARPWPSAKRSRAPRHPLPQKDRGWACPCFTPLHFDCPPSPERPAPQERGIHSAAGRHTQRIKLHPHLRKHADLQRTARSSNSASNCCGVLRNEFRAPQTAPTA